MPEMAKLTFRGRTYELPVVEGSEGELAIDISNLRAESGLITLDEGYANTGACQSAITFIDGEKGILRHRGYAIEDLAEHSTFIETAYLVIFGELPTKAELAEWRSLLTEYMFIHEDLKHFFAGFPASAHPMAILSAMVNAAGCFTTHATRPEDDESFMQTAARIISRVRTIAAASYKKSVGHPIMYPRPDLTYPGNFLHMMFSRPNMNYEPDPDVVRALDQLFILHCDHEQNCSTSTVRMVGSSQASLYASVSSGICALWGPLHGGANQAVLTMLEEIRASGQSPEQFLAKVKDRTAHTKLMGFGHRVYKNYDPRARIIKQACDKVLAKLHKSDPLLDIARKMEEVALKDSYFIERKLYPNVDFYSGIIMRAIGIPTNMFTVIFAIGRTPGWIAQWREQTHSAKPRICRPRQIYVGPKARKYVPVEQRA